MHIYLNYKRYTLSLRKLGKYRKAQPLVCFWNDLISKNSLCMYLFSFPGTLLLFKGESFLWRGQGGETGGGGRERGRWRGGCHHRQMGQDPLTLWLPRLSPWGWGLVSLLFFPPLMEISHSLCPSSLYFLNLKDQKKTHWKLFLIHLSAWVYFSCLLSVLTSPPPSGDSFPKILVGIEKPTTPLHIFGPATTNSRVSFGRPLPDSNSCKTEKPQIQST